MCGALDSTPSTIKRKLKKTTTAKHMLSKRSQMQMTTNCMIYMKCLEKVSLQQQQIHGCLGGSELTATERKQLHQWKCSHIRAD